MAARCSSCQGNSQRSLPQEIPGTDRRRLQGNVVHVVKGPKAARCLGCPAGDTVVSRSGPSENRAPQTEDERAVSTGGEPHVDVRYEV